MIIDTPPGMHHFRDPKVWREGESWYMVVGARVDDVGQVRLYRSDDLRHWQDAGILARPKRGWATCGSARISLNSMASGC